MPEISRFGLEGHGVQSTGRAAGRCPSRMRARAPRAGVSVSTASSIPRWGSRADALAIATSLSAPGDHRRHRVERARRDHARLGELGHRAEQPRAGFEVAVAPVAPAEDRGAVDEQDAAHSNRGSPRGTRGSRRGTPRAARRRRRRRCPTARRPRTARARRRPRTARACRRSDGRARLASGRLPRRGPPGRRRRSPTRRTAAWRCGGSPLVSARAARPSSASRTLPGS